MRAQSRCLSTVSSPRARLNGLSRLFWPVRNVPPRLLDAPTSPFGLSVTSSELDHLRPFRQSETQARLIQKQVCRPALHGVSIERESVRQHVCPDNSPRAVTDNPPTLPENSAKVVARTIQKARHTPFGEFNRL